MNLFESPRPLRQRFRPLLWLGICFVVIAFVTRLVLLLMAGSGVPASPLYWLYAFGIGFCYDVVTFIYVAWPLLLFLWLVPSRRGRVSGLTQWLLYALVLAALCAACLLALHLMYHASLAVTWPVLLLFLFLLPMRAFTYGSRTGQRVLYGFALALLFFLLFVAASELTFWEEFGTRFNFIAVDYLVYTREVIGNIRQSYPIGLWLSLLALATIVIVVVTRRGLRTADDGSRFGRRTLVVLGWLALTVLSALAVNADMKNRTRNVYVNSLAGNGIYEFFSAFRNARLDFKRFYPTLPDDRAWATVRDMLQTPDATYVGSDPRDLTRAIRNPGPEQHLNVVLISVESLSASYMGIFGDTKGLTPYLDDLAGKSLFFDQLYANGTRTVRGLEALSLSVPPTPGDSLVKEKHNEDLFSLADIFNQRGYVSEFVYGGYGQFDNMNYFFAHNGYVDVDRRDIPAAATIHHENVWGVADEDLYTLAMGEMDRIHAKGKPFFLHIMTTSNHRPYTFPEGRIDMPQGLRSSAIKYTDWAIGDFIKRMRAKPYFADTVFVITADHCGASAGATSIPLNRYHIPLYIYAPAHIAPRRVGRMMAQLDIPPTLLGLLHFSYRSRFFGYDLMRLPAGRERAFPSTYQNLGYLRGDRMTILAPQQKLTQVRPDPVTGDATPYAQIDRTQADQAIASYQVAADMFKSGAMRWRASDATPVLPAPAASVPVPATSVAPL